MCQRCCFRTGVNNYRVKPAETQAVIRQCPRKSSYLKTCSLTDGQIFTKCWRLWTIGEPAPASGSQRDIDNRRPQTGSPDRDEGVTPASADKITAFWSQIYWTVITVWQCHGHPCLTGMFCNYTSLSLLLHQPTTLMKQIFCSFPHFFPIFILIVHLPCPTRNN